MPVLILIPYVRAEKWQQRNEPRQQLFSCQISLLRFVSPYPIQPVEICGQGWCNSSLWKAKHLLKHLLLWVSDIFLSQLFDSWTQDRSILSWIILKQKEMQAQRVWRHKSIPVSFLPYDVIADATWPPKRLFKWHYQTWTYFLLYYDIHCGQVQGNLILSPKGPSLLHHVQMVVFLNEDQCDAGHVELLTVERSNWSTCNHFFLEIWFYL